MCCAAPRRLNWTVAFRQICIAIHRSVAGNQPSHRMRYDVEFQIRTVELVLQTVDAPHELASVSDVVPPPVVCVDVEGVLITIRSGVGPVAVTITGVPPQSFK